MVKEVITLENKRNSIDTKTTQGLLGKKRLRRTRKAMQEESQREMKFKSIFYPGFSEGIFENRTTEMTYSTLLFHTEHESCDEYMFRVLLKDIKPVALRSANSSYSGNPRVPYNATQVVKDMYRQVEDCPCDFEINNAGLCIYVESLILKDNSMLLNLGDMGYLMNGAHTCAFAYTMAQNGELDGENKNASVKVSVRVMKENINTERLARTSEALNNTEPTKIYGRGESRGVNSKLRASSGKYEDRIEFVENTNIGEQGNDRRTVMDLFSFAGLMYLPDGKPCKENMSVTRNSLAKYKRYKTMKEEGKVVAIENVFPILEEAMDLLCYVEHNTKASVTDVNFRRWMCMYKRETGYSPKKECFKTQKSWLLGDTLDVPYTKVQWSSIMSALAVNIEYPKNGEARWRVNPYTLYDRTQKDLWGVLRGFYRQLPPIERTASFAAIYKAENLDIWEAMGDIVEDEIQNMLMEVSE